MATIIYYYLDDAHIVIIMFWVEIEINKVCWHYLLTKVELIDY